MLRDLAIYLAGPMTGLPDYNHQAFIDAEMDLRIAGCQSIINPVRFAPQPHWDAGDYLGRAAAVLACGAVGGLVLLPGWEQSNGASLEREIATRTGLAVYELREFFAALYDESKAPA